MNQDDLEGWKAFLIDPLEKLQSILIEDSDQRSRRPDAPIDEMILNANVITCPLLFKVYLDGLYKDLSRQRSRTGLSTRTMEQIDVSLSAVEETLKGFHFNLSRILDQSDMRKLGIGMQADAKSAELTYEKLQAIERIAGHPIAPRERQFRFATWPKDGSINDQLFPSEQQLHFSDGFHLQELPIPPSDQVIGMRLESKPISLSWSELLNRYPIDQLYREDAVIFPQDVSWYIAFCHGDYGVFARRK